MYIVNSHDFNSQHFKLRVSDPRGVGYFHLETPRESSSLPGAGPSRLLNSLKQDKHTWIEHIYIYIYIYIYICFPILKF